MRETIREFGLEQLAASGEEPAVQQAHAAWYLEFGERVWWEAGARGPIRPAWLNRAEAELGNLRAALAWLERAGDVEGRLRLASAFWVIWLFRGYRSEGLRLLELALTSGVGASPVTRAWALLVASSLAVNLWRNDQAAVCASEALSLYQDLGDDWGIAVSFSQLASVALGESRYHEAARLFEQALQLFDEQREKDWIALITYYLAAVAYGEADLARAEIRFEESLRMHRELEDVWGTAVCLDGVGVVACDRGDFATAATRFAESLPLRRQLRSKEELVHWLGGVASLAGACGKPAAAARLLAAAATFRETAGLHFRFPLGATYDRSLAVARDTLRPEAFAAAWAAGQVLTLDQAVALAEETLERATESVASTSIDPLIAAGLTSREREIFCLLAAGMRNSDIADALFIGRRTVTTHVQHIFGKLGFTHRQQATVFARDRDLC